MSYKGRTAIITGGTGALGSVVVRSFLDSGAQVAIPYSSEKSLAGLKAVTERFAGSVLAAQTDLTEESQVRPFLEQTTKRFGSIEYLINTAGGYAGGKTIDDVTLDEWQGIMQLNVTTTFLTCRGVLPAMRSQGFGRIVNIAAMPALLPAAKKGPYQVSKRAVITLTETIAAEVKGTGITANAIAPSTIVTPANKASMPDADTSRWVTPEEISSLVLYLCSDEARSVSGNVIRIFGGM